MSNTTQDDHALSQAEPRATNAGGEGTLRLLEEEAPGKEVAGEAEPAAEAPPLPAGPVLVIAAHPDDPDFGCGGTMARLVDAGRRVVVVVVTDGTEGGEDPSVPDDDLRDLREAEQRAALAELGGDVASLLEVEFLRFPDGRLQASLELRRALTAMIRRYRPATVFTHDPTAHIDRGYINHPDHRATGLATLDAIFPAAGNPRAFRDLLAEGLEPHKVSAVYLFYTAKADTWIDISEVIPRKAAGLRHHRSQIANLDDLEKGVREWAEETGKAGNLAAAEAFRRLVLHRDE
jgi:LmbE family N-acetylglucosaminyl deacetylase